MKKIYSILFAAISLSISAQFSGNVSCSGTITCNNPTVSVFFSPTTPSSFAIIGWSNGSTLNPTTYSMGGIATITVNNAGTNYTFSGVINMNNLPPSFTLSSSPATCSNCCDGQIVVAASGNYSYTLNGNSQGLMFSPTFTGICTGTQVVCAKNINNGCVKCDSIAMSYSVNTGLRKNSLADQASFYPNPTYSILNIQFSKEFSGKIDCYNLLGQNCKSAFLNSEKFWRLDFTGMPEGIYTVVMINEEGERVVEKVGITK